MQHALIISMWYTKHCIDWTRSQMFICRNAVKGNCDRLISRLPWACHTPTLLALRKNAHSLACYLLGSAPHLISNGCVMCYQVPVYIWNHDNAHKISTATFCKLDILSESRIQSLSSLEVLIRAVKISRQNLFFMIKWEGKTVFIHDLNITLSVSYTPITMITP